MDVLHITEACGAGVRRHLQLIVPALVERGISCGVFAYGSRFEPGFAEEMERLASAGCQVKLQRTDGDRLLNLPSAVNCIEGLYRSWAPGIAHLHAYAAGIAGRLASMRPMIVYSPHAFGIHSPVSCLKRGIVRTTEVFLARRTNAFSFVGSAELEDAFKLGLPREKCFLLQNGLPASFRTRLKSRSEALAALGICPKGLAAVAPCRLEPQKGLHILLDALALLGDAAPNVFIFGEGSQKTSLAKQAAKLGIERVVSFMQPRPDLVACLKAFDIGIIPSFYEGLSYSLLELLCAGVPLVASDTGANAPLPWMGRCVNYFSNGSKASLAGALRNIAANLTSARERAVEAQTHACADFSLQKQVEALAALYRSLRRSKE